MLLIRPYDAVNNQTFQKTAFYASAFSLQASQVDQESEHTQVSYGEGTEIIINEYIPIFIHKHIYKHIHKRIHIHIYIFILYIYIYILLYI